MAGIAGTPDGSALGRAVQPVRAPGIRASTADRQRCADALAQAYAVGQLDDDELSERLDQALRAKTLGDLAGLTTDLNPQAMGLAVPAPAPAVAAWTPAPPPARRIPPAAAAVAVGVALAFILAVALGMMHSLGSVRSDEYSMGSGMGMGMGNGQVVVAGDDDQPTWIVDDIDNLPSPLEVGSPNATVDLRGLDIMHNAVLDIHTGTGPLTIQLPVDGTVVLQYTVSDGSFAAVGGTGDSAAGAGTHTWSDGPDSPALTLRVAVDQGSLTVVRPS